MTDQPMEITYDCGHVQKNVGVLTMALRAHLSSCQDQACRADVEETLREHS